MSDKALFKPGDFFAKSQQYEVIRMLGCGGYGQVYLTKCKTTNEERAAKIETRKKKNHLINEVEVYKLLSRSTCSPDFFEADITAYPRWMIMSVEGQSLSQIRESSEDGIVSARRLLSISYHAVKAFQELHQLGIVHRDVRAMNICLRKTPTKNPIVILDFGMSGRVLQPDGSRIYTCSRDFSNRSMASLNVREKRLPKEVDDLESYGYVMLRLRDMWDISEKSDEEAIAIRRRLHFELSDFLDVDNQFLLEPLLSIFSQSYDAEMPDYKRILDAIRASADFREEAWSHH